MRRLLFALLIAGPLAAQTPSQDSVKVLRRDFGFIESRAREDRLLEGADSSVPIKPPTTPRDGKTALTATPLASAPAYHPKDAVVSCAGASVAGILRLLERKANKNQRSR